MIGDRLVVSKMGDNKVQSVATKLDSLIYSLAHSLSLHPFVSVLLFPFFKTIGLATVLVIGILGHLSLRLCKSCFAF